MASGKSYPLFSGLSLTDSYVYSTHDTLGYAKTSLLIRADRTGSGVGYIVRGYFAPHDGRHKLVLDTPHVITSGQLTTSGQITVITSGLDLAYQSIDVGVKADATKQSGIATVLVASKRR